MTDSDRFLFALRLIDEANRQDPNLERWEGQDYPKEYLYSLRMSAWLTRLDPEADEARRLAARAQHIRRWMLPRDRYPMTREGYLRWRTELYDFHAKETAEILARAGYGEEAIGRVGAMLRKRGLKRNPDTQMIEDVACLVFLEHYFLPFAAGQDEAKLIDIVQKTWKKMSAPAREAALNLPFPDDIRALLGRALAGAGG
jgi:hypothetical protein